jgi:hypothetical protein
MPSASNRVYPVHHAKRHGREHEYPDDHGDGKDRGFYVV